jgi:long-chain acyl-CoA synthetase
MGGENRAFVSVIVAINYENVGNWAETQHVGYTTFVDLSQKPQVYELIKKDMQRVNRNLTGDLKIHKFVNLHKEFDADDAELTRSGKLRRKFMEERYGELVESIYSGKEEYEVVASVKYKDGRTGSIKTHVRFEEVE